MKQNMGTTDRVIRFILAGAFFILWFEDLAIKGILGTILLVLSCVLAVTSFLGKCPLYSLLGISTCKMNKKGDLTH